MKKWKTSEINMLPNQEKTNNIEWVPVEELQKQIEKRILELDTSDKQNDFWSGQRTGLGWLLHSLEG